MYEFDPKLYIGETKRLTISPNGWINPIEIEYGVAHAKQFDTMNSIVWHVVGTKHYFSIYEPYMASYAKEGYAAHFKKVLESFRQDYLLWQEDEYYQGCAWADEYRKEFARFIKPREGSNNKRRS